LNLLKCSSKRKVLLTAFGDALRGFRQASNDPARQNKRLSQQRLGRLIGEELGDLGFTGAAVSYWETGASKISAEDRDVLLALIKVLHNCGGLKTLADANRLLEAGNYRALNYDEAGRIFVEILTGLNPQSEGNTNSSVPFVEESFFAVTGKEFKAIIARAKEEGPKPWWPRALAALLRKATDHFPLSIRTLLWVWVWLMAGWPVGPSLRLSFAGPAEMLSALQKYVIGSLIIPLMIGLLVNTKDSAYWQQRSDVKPLLLRLYTYQGAGIGFNLGYFFVFPVCLAIYYLHLEPTIWTEILAATVGLILGNMGARVVPHNLWRAFGRLAWSDGAIFFVVALLGPLWAIFFMEFYPILLDPWTGILMFLSAVTVMVILTTPRPKKHDN
jgi:hypothetical protein